MPADWTSPRDASGARASPASSCSSRSWLDWASIGWCSKPAIRAHAWCPPPGPC
jgi:hypothetical protein